MIEARPLGRPTSPRPIPHPWIVAARLPAIAPYVAPQRQADRRAAGKRYRRTHRRRAPLHPAEEHCHSQLKCWSFGSPVILVWSAVPEVPDKGVGIVSLMHALEAPLVTPTAGSIVEQDVPV